MIRRVLTFDRQICSGCGLCISTCPTRALIRGRKSLTLKEVACISCLECVEVCPTGALSEFTSNN